MPIPGGTNEGTDPWTGGVPPGWAGLPNDWWPSWAAQMGGPQAQRLQGWMAQFLPYLQAYQQSQQFGTEFDWRKEMDQWSQAFQGGQFDWQKEQDVWSRGLQEQMFGWEQEQAQWGQGFQEQQLKADQEAANLAAFGRRWKPTTRWT